MLAARSHASWRRIIILKREALSRQWDKFFPRHDWDTVRLKRFSLETFERLCDRAEAEAKKVRRGRQKRARPGPEDSLERAWQIFNDPQSQPTPAVTVEAIWLCIRERGLAALQEPVNRERLARCDDAARAELDRRLAVLQEAK
jgi:hypothetical protein